MGGAGRLPRPGQELGGLHPGRRPRGFPTLSAGEGRARRAAPVELPGNQHVGPRPLGRLRRQSPPRAPAKAVEPDREETVRRVPLFGRHLRRPQQGDLQPVLLEPRPTGCRDDQGVHCLRVFAGRGWRCRGRHRNPRTEPSSRPHQSQRGQGIRADPGGREETLAHSPPGLAVAYPRGSRLDRQRIVQAPRPAGRRDAEEGVSTS